MAPLIAISPVDHCNNCGSGAAISMARGPDFEYGTCANEFEFVACSDCGLVYLRDRPGVEALPVIYPPSYIPYRFNEHLGPFIGRLRNFVQSRKVDAIRRYASKHAFVVDVGPGSGELLRLLKTFGDPGWRLLGIDLAPEAIDNLKRLGIEGQLARFESMEWSHAKPSIIIMNQVIEHLDDPARVVRKAHELLEPGGVLFLETPSVDGWDAKLFRRRYWGGWHTPRHWTLYSEGTLGALLRRHGFEIVETTYLLSPNFWLQSVHHLIAERFRMQRLARLFDVSVLPMLMVASALDMLQKAVRGRTSNFRIVGKKTQ